jgi:RNA polymerase sigma factor, sigma-70 family/RNA polymerase sigma-70 factor, sigma-B/F/G subfamily
MSKYKVELNGFDINKCEKLNHQQMMELLSDYTKTKDEKIKERLIYANLKLVLSLVQKYHQRIDNLDDLFQVGIIGLIKAIDHFDVTLDLRFSTYAVPLIIGEIKRYLRDNSPMRIPRSLRDIAYKALMYTDEFTKENNREPTIEEISNKLSISRELLLEAIGSTYSVTSLSQEIQNDGTSVDLESQIKDTRNNYKEVNNKLDLSNALKHLDEKENLIIRQRYYEGQTQSEIADELFISQAQVSRIEKQALKRLQKYI